ncbi:hypothetical protein AaE_007509 [Aphanomyces astaci]|uniref:WRKY transcription factor 19 n=1 Tax=Aphanomyces astaci TaxID=112090 RepID=A0A6A5AHA6_APHAT|nr:hypothetical protein AaE_007509 [Aphanomyces astaci]
MSCYFKGCARPVLQGAAKCDFHRQRSMCVVADCRNQVFARNLCVRHGGKKSCVHEGCRENVRVGDLCGKHGASAHRKMCIEDGCDKFAQTKQRCSAHGGGQRCKRSGCFAHARRGGFCTRHSSLSRLNKADRSEELVEVCDRVQCPPFTLFPKVAAPAVNKLSLSLILNPHESSRRSNVEWT